MNDKIDKDLNKGDVKKVSKQQTFFTSPFYEQRKLLFINTLQKNNQDYIFLRCCHTDIRELPGCS